MIALVTGGASCGKSAYAEDLCTSLGSNLVYLAAMQPFGEEGARRVARHRALRAGKGFETVECYEDFGAVVRDERIVGATVLLECLGNVVANELYKDGTFSQTVGAAGVADSIMGTIEQMAGVCEHVVVVGNEVGADGVSYSAETRAYQDLLGEVSRALAARSDIVVECVAGIPIVYKDR